MPLSPACPEDVAVVAQQIGRRPVGLIGIAARCPSGHPAVVTTYPIRRDRGGLRPFPTFFWLTCPHLRRVLSRLEMAGAIGRIEGFVRRDQALLARLDDDHAQYIGTRWDALTAADRALAEREPALAALRTRGIGGLSDRTAIKCLHLHYAHHLAQGNVVGEFLERQFDLTSCPAATAVPSCLTS